MSGRPTPDTDAARHDLSDCGSPVPCSWGDWVAADFACKVERERDEAREAAAKWESSSDAMERAGAEQARRADENREWAVSAELERNEAREKAERYRLEANAMMAKLHELQTYADKLADGLPAGMLPKDVENLREANAGLAEDLQKAERERDEAILELGAIQATIAEAFNLPRTPLTAADVHAALNHLTQ